MIGFYTHTLLTLLCYLFSKPFIPQFEVLWSRGVRFIKKLPPQDMTAYIRTFRVREVLIYASIILLTLVAVAASFTSFIEPLIRYWDEIHLLSFMGWLFVHLLVIGISCIVASTSVAQFVITSRLIRFNFQLAYKIIKSLGKTEEIDNELSDQDEERSTTLLPAIKKPELAINLTDLEVRRIGEKNSKSAVLVNNLRTVIKFHAVAIEMVSASDEFWKRFLFCHYTTLTPTLTFMIYQVIKGNLSFIFGFVLIGWTISIAFMVHTTRCRAMIVNNQL